MTKVFIFAPANVAGGGPELCHQLIDAINGQADHRRAYIVYYPMDVRHEVPWWFLKYRVDVATMTDIGPDSIVVLPEVNANVVGMFERSQVYFWWMSVDNFAAASVFRGEDPQKSLQALSTHVTRHLYQSDYARTFLESHSLTPASRLGDRLSDGFLQDIRHPPTGPRQNLLVYNPHKGMERTQKVLDALVSHANTPEMVAVDNMHSDQVRSLLSKAKLYIDFGHHPGKDRLPREAAACGACVLVNRRGAAANPVDMPIPEDYKIADDGDVEGIVERIHEIMADYDQQRHRFDQYRSQIAQEAIDFEQDVKALFPAACGS